ncbi:MAG: hypothetical protein ABSB30_05755 [Terracidiphilus sp.]|jgi:hypothetical protein
MAHLWLQDTISWRAQRLDAAQYELAASPTPQAVEAPMGTACGETARLIRTDKSGMPAWALIASHNAGVRVNSRGVTAGLCVLSDRDEIRIGNGSQYFFSTETPATVVPFPGADRTVYCGRCREPIEAGAPAVRCPNPSCGIWYNESAELPCWTYSDKCSFCGYPTADAGFSWTPED